MAAPLLLLPNPGLHQPDWAGGGRGIRGGAGPHEDGGAAAAAAVVGLTHHQLGFVVVECFELLLDGSLLFLNILKDGLNQMGKEDISLFRNEYVIGIFF